MGLVLFFWGRGTLLWFSNPYALVIKHLQSALGGWVGGPWSKWFLPPLLVLWFSLNSLRADG